MVHFQSNYYVDLKKWFISNPTICRFLKMVHFQSNYMQVLKMVHFQSNYMQIKKKKGSFPIQLYVDLKKWFISNPTICRFKKMVHFQSNYMQIKKKKGSFPIQLYVDLKKWFISNPTICTSQWIFRIWTTSYL